MENLIIVVFLFSISNQTTIVNNASSAVAKKHTQDIPCSIEMGKEKFLVAPVDLRIVNHLRGFDLQKM